jgi:branched-chain amino acid transport system substrate-binding protein
LGKAKSFTLAFAVTLLAAACGSSGDGEIVIGTAGPLAETRGEMSRMGAQLAIKEVNARGGVRGRRLALRALDDSARGVTAVRVAETWAAAPAVVAVVGHVTSGAMMMAARVYDAEQLPAVATTASSPELSGISPWVFRTIASDSSVAVAMARHASQAGFRSAAVLYENDSYGRALAGLFRQNFRGEVLSTDPIAAADSNFEPFVSYYRARRPDVVLLAGSEGSGLRFLREARRQRLETTVVGANSLVGIATADPAASEGVLIFAPFTPADPRPEVRTFVAAFVKEYGRPPSSHAALAYDATLVIARAIERAGVSREGVRDWLAALDEKSAVAGVTGPLRFQGSGDRLGREVTVTRVRDGVLAVEVGS